jgi:hypothetical protein
LQQAVAPLANAERNRFIDVCLLQAFKLQGNTRWLAVALLVLSVQAYARCPSKNRAVLLTYSLKRQMRLVFLAQQGLQEKQHKSGAVGVISMSTIMSWSEERMQQQHPQYTAWYDRHAAAAIEAEQAARAAAATEGNARPQAQVCSVQW